MAGQVDGLSCRLSNRSCLQERLFIYFCIVMSHRSRINSDVQESTMTKPKRQRFSKPYVVQPNLASMKITDVLQIGLMVEIWSPSRIKMVGSFRCELVIPKNSTQHRDALRNRNRIFDELHQHVHTRTNIWAWWYEVKVGTKRDIFPDFSQSFLEGSLLHLINFRWPHSLMDPVKSIRNNSPLLTWVFWRKKAQLLKNP